MAFFMKKADSQGGESAPGPLRKPTPALASEHFHAWLEVVNSGNPGRLGRFLQENAPQLPSSRPSYVRDGGFDLRRTDEETESRFVGILQDRGIGLWSRVVLESQPQAPWSITRLDYEPIDPVPKFNIPRMSERDALAAFRLQLDDASADETFSGAVLVAKDGAELFTGAYGLANRERCIPNRVDSRFRIASTGKIFAAVAALQLVQRGVLDLSEPIGRYLPDYPNKEAAGRITAHQLLTHTAGLTGAMGGPPSRSRDSIQPLQSLDDWVRVFGPMDLEHEPGTKWSYSNYGFALVGHLVGRITGQDYFDYVVEHVFGRADMTSSGWEPNKTGDRDSTGYQRNWETGEWQVSMTAHVRAHSVGSNYSTVEDLKRFVDALFGHRLLDDRHTQLLLEPKVEADPRGGARESYGCQLFEHYGVPWYCRTGSAMGESGELRIYPESGYVIVVLANMGAPAAFRMARFIGDRLPAT